MLLQCIVECSIYPSLSSDTSEESCFLLKTGKEQTELGRKMINASAMAVLWTLSANWQVAEGLQKQFSQKVATLTGHTAPKEL